MNLVNKEQVEGCKCKPVCFNNIKSYSHIYVQDMIKIMKANCGIGLAAPQVGIFKRFFVMKYGNNYIACFNPKILFSSPQKSSLMESCLTYPVPQLKGRLTRPQVNIMRPKTIKVEYQDVNGDITTMKLRGLESKCFQHELDHLDGITIFYRGSK